MSTISTLSQSSISDDDRSLCDSNETPQFSPSCGGHDPLQFAWLMLPFDNQDDEANSYVSTELVNLKHDYGKRSFIVSEDCWRNRCVASSRGWLVLLNERANPYLVNPFSNTRVQLPLLDTFPETVRCEEDDMDGFFTKRSALDNSKEKFEFKTLTAVLLGFIKKVILSSSHGLCQQNNEKGYVIAIYGDNSKLAYCRLGNSSWSRLDSSNKPYMDIIYDSGSVLALSHNGHVEQWNFQGDYPVKVKEFNASFPKKSSDLILSMKDFYTSQSYIVVCGGAIMLVVRFIGRFMNPEGKLVTERELSSIPMDCPYRTLFFHVYKLDFGDMKWMEVKSLRNRVIFVGGNESVSLQASSFLGVQENSIYFTDDYWGRMFEDDYGGHDMGLYRLGDDQVKLFNFVNNNKLEFRPSPFFIIPNQNMG